MYGKGAGNWFDKLLDAIKYIEKGNTLEGRSFYLLIDIFKLHCYYEGYGYSGGILSAIPFAKLYTYLCANIEPLKFNGTIPNLITESAIVNQESGKLGRVDLNTLNYIKALLPYSIPKQKLRIRPSLKKK